MSQVVDFENVSTEGLTSSAVADALAGLRANEARYYENKYGHIFNVQSAAEAAEVIDWVSRVLREERDLVIARSASVSSACSPVDRDAGLTGVLGGAGQRHAGHLQRGHVPAWPASHTASAPSPQPTSSTRAGDRPATSATSAPLGCPLHSRL